MKTTTEDPAQRAIRVWDPFLRLSHWSLVIAVVTAWFTRHARGDLHDWIGYAALAVVALRTAWGFTGPRYARFRQFLRPPAVTLAYLRDTLSGSAPRFIGHNPLGGWMSMVLLGTVGLICITGWLYTTDRFWGVAWVGNLHLWLTWVLMGLVGLHLLGVAWSSLKHRENLVASMIHGAKTAPGEQDQV